MKIDDKNLPFSVGFFSPNFVALFTYLKTKLSHTTFISFSKELFFVIQFSVY